MDEKLARLGIILPVSSSPAAHYSNYAFTDNGLLFLAGKGPGGNPRGKLGSEYSTEQGYRFARSAGIEVLAVLQEALGSLERVKRILKVQGFVNADSEFSEHHKVMNGFSDLMAEIFEENGVHARSVLGANSLRDQLPVIVECIVEIYPSNEGDVAGSNGGDYSF
jgi:enamine deaminase RidA (YjgF/YER057c/UK114 family)